MSLLELDALLVQPRLRPVPRLSPLLPLSRLRRSTAQPPVCLPSLLLHLPLRLLQVSTSTPRPRRTAASAKRSRLRKSLPSLLPTPPPLSSPTRIDPPFRLVWRIRSVYLPHASLVAHNQSLPVPTVVDQFRQFVGTEREKVEAKKQSMIRSDREKTLADFKKFQTSFKVS